MASISDKVNDLGDYLREQRQAARLSVRQLARLAGVSNPYLSQIERGLRKPSAEVLQQLAEGLRISAEALYIKAGILDPEGRPDVEAAIAADPGLTDRQRRALLDIYASFKAENLRSDTDRPVLDTASPETALPTAPGQTTARPKTARPKTAGKKTAGPKTAAPKRTTSRASAASGTSRTRKTARKRPAPSADTETPEGRDQRSQT